jgi:hypothetical protein
MLLVLFACVPSDDGKSAELVAKLDALQARIAQLEKRSEREDLIQESQLVAFLTPANQGYSVLKTEMGALTVNLESLQPSQTGTQVTLRFGNVSNATLDRVKATVEWGKSDTGLKSEATGSREIAFAVPFPRGQWVNLGFVLDGVLPQDIAFIRIKNLEHNGISLLGLPSPAARSRD